MKKPLKVLVLGTAAMGAVLGLFWWDCVRRAEASIVAQEERLRAEMAAVRARPDAVNLIASLGLSSDALARVTPAAVFFDPSTVRRLRFEQGHSGQREACHQLDEAYSHLDGRQEISESPESVLAWFAVAQEVLREAGERGGFLWDSVERKGLEVLRRMLVERTWTTPELRRLHAGLEELWKVRLTSSDAARGTAILDGIELLRVLRTREDPMRVMERSPCWRELYSWSILIAKTLHEVEEKEEPARDSHLGELRYRLGEYLPMLDHSNADGWSKARVAVGILLFRAEKGREPSQLAELVPEYLTEIPLLRTYARREQDLQKDFRGEWSERTSTSVWPVLRR